MNWIANVLVALVALLHIYFLALEMFLWTKPLGLKTFGQSLDKATDSAVLAANQGLYNGFLAAGLVRFTGEAHPGLFDAARYPALAAHAARCEALPPFQEIVQPLSPPSGS